MQYDPRPLAHIMDMCVSLHIHHDGLHASTHAAVLVKTKHYLDIFNCISQEDLALNETVIQPAFTELELPLPRDECLTDVCENLFATCLYVT